jgi:hypothetical protein
MKREERKYKEREREEEKEGNRNDKKMKKNISSSLHSRSKKNNVQRKTMMICMLYSYTFVYLNEYANLLLWIRKRKHTRKRIKLKKIFLITFLL